MTTNIRHEAVFKAIEKWAPRHLAYDWDNVGLQIGSSASETKKVMVTLDVLENVVDEAVEKNVNLIIAHHPLLFKALKQINTDSPSGRIIKKLLKHDITVYAAHTNLDAAEGGMNDILCNKLGIQKTKTLLQNYTEPLVKLVVYVPETHAKEVRNALGEQGAGFIGNYSHCTYQTSGQGTFMPQEGTNPYIGSSNEMSFVDEVKIETIVEDPILTDVINAMKKAHPYEEAAYDIYPLQNPGKSFGIGRIGLLPEKCTLSQLCEHVKQSLDLPSLRVTGDLNKTVNKVAVLGGSGEKYIHAAKQKGADVYITGDMTFHTAQDAWQAGLSVIDPGHHAEKVMIQTTKDYLDKYFADKAISVIESTSDTNPFQFV